MSRDLDGPVVVTIEPLAGGGIGWKVEYPNGGSAMGAAETFPGARVAVDDVLRRSVYHR